MNSEPYYASKKLLTSRQIFRYAVPARTVTKKHWLPQSGTAESRTRDLLSRKSKSQRRESNWRPHVKGHTKTTGHVGIEFGCGDEQCIIVSITTPCCSESLKISTFFSLCFCIMELRIGGEVC